VDYDYVIELAQIRKHDVRKAGGKGANLGEMIETGIPVPQGFVVSTASFDRLIYINNLDDKIQQIIDSTDVDDTAGLLEASRKIKELILFCTMPHEIESKVIEAYKNLSGHGGAQVNSRTDLPVVVAVRSSKKMIIEDLCKEGIAFASFGTNDLIQLVLGIDRNNERLAKMSSPFHPAILRSMKMVTDVCNDYGVESSICGESGSLSEMAKILVGYRIKSISCNIDVIDTIRAVVYQEEQKLVSK
jgi:phosphoenolpyruvate synthase/pyruvate phosphate dikinase